MQNSVEFCLLKAACALSFVLYSTGIFVTIISSKDPDVINSNTKWQILVFQMVFCTYVLCGFIVLVLHIRNHSYGYCSTKWNKVQMWFFVGLATFLLLFCVITTVWPITKFIYFNTYTLFGVFTSVIISIIGWRREQKTQTFVDQVLHANNMKNYPVTEQNARDLYKLREFDTVFKSLVGGYRYSNERRLLTYMCHPEYYYCQQWMRSLKEVLDGKSDENTLNALYRDMARRCEVFNLDAKHQRRYQDLVAMPHLIIPIELEDQTEGGQLILGSSPPIHNNIST